MVATKTSRSAKIRAQLKHPIVDSDGHLVELHPVLVDYIKEIGGGDIARRYESHPELRRWQGKTVEERREIGAHITPWWVVPTRNALDRATASLPRLLEERMEELGLDFCVLYPTAGTVMPTIRDEEVRRVACRAMNAYLADLYGPYSRQMTPAAVILMDTPEIAIEELEYAVNTLGFKASMVAGYVQRPIPKGETGRLDSEYIDTFGVDSPYDYDPFWAKCIELGVPPASHSGGMGIGFRRSVWNYMYNHIGHFGAAGEALCKSLFFSGVTRRFPNLNVALLECGVGWACDVYAGIVGRWEKRNANAIHNMDPAMLDKEAVIDLIARYGDRRVTEMLEPIRSSMDRPSPTPEDLDDWSQCGIERAEDIRDRFVPNFYFGCEADDPMNVWAFNDKVNPMGARLNAILSSDIGHWDVPDMREVVGEAYEAVEKELMTEDDFRDFVFANPVRLYGKMNPDFYKGTTVEAAAAKLLESES